MREPSRARYQSTLGSLIFLSRWLQAPLYIGLIVAQGIYVYHFLVELAHLLTGIAHLDEKQIMLTVLGPIDVVMIANLFRSSISLFCHALVLTRGPWNASC